MTRAITSTVTKARHRKMLAMAKGYRGRASTCYRVAKQRVEKGLQYSYRDRRKKKMEFRSIWHIRINAGLKRCAGIDHKALRYSEFMHALNLSKIVLNRKMLAELAMNHPENFAEIVKHARGILVAQYGSRYNQESQINTQVQASA